MFFSEFLPSWSKGISPYGRKTQVPTPIYTYKLRNWIPANSASLMAMELQHLRMGTLIVTSLNDICSLHILLVSMAEIPVLCWGWIGLGTQGRSRAGRDLEWADPRGELLWGLATVTPKAEGQGPAGSVPTQLTPLCSPRGEQPHPPALLTGTRH